MLHLFYYQLAKFWFYLRSCRRGRSGFDANLIWSKMLRCPLYPQHASVSTPRGLALQLKNQGPRDGSDKVGEVKKSEIRVFGWHQWFSYKSTTESEFYVPYFSQQSNSNTSVISRQQIIGTRTDNPIALRVLDFYFKDRTKRNREQTVQERK